MDIANLSKSISVTKDKKTIGDMARYVFQCLEKFECSLRPPDWAGLVPPQACNMSANKYLGIVKVCLIKSNIYILYTYITSSISKEVC